MSEEITYKSAGVDVEEGERFVRLIKPLVESTYGGMNVSPLGGFAGAFPLDAGAFREPLLVSATDGVGTKLKTAFSARKFDTIGIDLVAMSANDVITCGAKPLFFLDYLATSKLDSEQAAEVVRGICEGCVQAGCVLMGGETAEMPGFYAQGEFDLAGFCVGVVEKDLYIDGGRVGPGDAVIGLASSGLHSNGYSLARKVLFDIGDYSLDSNPQGSLKNTRGGTSHTHGHILKGRARALRGIRRKSSCPRNGRRDSGEPLKGHSRRTFRGNPRSKLAGSSGF